MPDFSQKLGRNDVSPSLCNTIAPTMRAIPKRSLQLNVSILLAVMCLVISACTLTKAKVVDNVLVESPRGTVFLQSAADGWFRTAHPLSLHPAFLASIFQGVQVKTAPTGRTEGDPVFSNEETKFLSAQMSTALSKAATRQVVGFRVHHEMDAGGGTTGGILYVQGRLLHLTFTHYRAQGEQLNRDSASGRIVQNPTGLDTRHLSFVPESARRSSRNEQPDIIKTLPLASLVIDYAMLPSWMAPPTGHAAAAQELHGAPAGDIGAAQVVGRGEETEFEVLQKEMRMLQHRLSELDLQLQNSKKP
jgi:hypothetical protein